MHQLPLQVRLRDFAVFETFEPGPNGAVLALLSDPAVAGHGVWVWGAEGSGKSHLLQACCAAHDGAAYLPAEDLLPAGADSLAGWRERALICIDDVDRLIGREDWEFALFALFNRLWEAGGCLVVSAPVAPGTLDFRLPDLRSRLAWGGVFRLEPLGDADRVAALRRRAAHRGLELSPEAARFLLRRLPRDMRALCGWLDTLDAASLAAGKRLTVPFVKSVIEAASARPSA